jgi:5-(carboxyamino)imidazole ribonucleotide mutase
MDKPFVAVLMGSVSDLPVMEAGFEALGSLDAPFEARVASAHRTTEMTNRYVTEADQSGCAAPFATAGIPAASLATQMSALPHAEFFGAQSAVLPN